MAVQPQPSRSFIIDTDLADPNNFVHSVTINGKNSPDTLLSVPRKIQIKSQCVIGDARISPVRFFGSIGCLDSEGHASIDMCKLNIVKQYLDMIKDGTSPVLMRQLMGTFLARQSIPVVDLRYPVTLDLIKEYFNKHYNDEGKLHKVFWARDAEFPGFPALLMNTPSIHDCGFKDERPSVVGPSTGIDPLAQGKVNQGFDIQFPEKGASITWNDNTLQSLGYPPGCSITATNNGIGGKGKVDWVIEVVCCNGDGMIVKANNHGIWDNAGNPISIKEIRTINQLNQGNTFKSYIQSQTNQGAKTKLPLLLILLALVFIKSFGDNSIDLTQRSAQLINQLFAIIFTCDFTLFLSAMTWGGMAVLTTNAPDMDQPGRTGNLSTLFIPRELTAREEIKSIFDSCKAENDKYLTMLKEVYGKNSDRHSVMIKIGGEVKEIHLWFLYIIINAIETCMTNHKAIFDIFITNTNDNIMNKPDWFLHKNKILSLFKSYCKIVCPFVNGIDESWRVLANPTLTSNSPRVNGDTERPVADIEHLCEEIITMNKDSLKPQIKSFVEEIARKGKHISIKTINLQQLAILIGKYAIPIKDFKVPTLEGAAAAVVMVGDQGGGRNRNYNLTGGMNPLKRQKVPGAAAAGPPLLAAAGPPPPLLQVEAAAAAPLLPAPNEEQQQQELQPQQEPQQQQQELELEQEPRQQQELQQQQKIADDSTAEFTSIMQNIMSLLSNFDQNTGHDLSPELLYLFYEIKKPVYTLILILVSSCLSQLLKYLSLLITEDPPTYLPADAAAAGAAGGGDDDGDAKSYQMNIISTTCVDISTIVEQYKILGMLHHVDDDDAGSSDVNILAALVTVMGTVNVERYGETTKLNLACLYSIFENTNEHITTFLLENGINPSSDTLYFAKLRLNLSIFYRCVLDVNSEEQNSFITMYRSAQQANVHYSEYIPVGLHIGRETPNNYSFYEEYYSLMKNIAYNVFYTFEYQLPLSCDEEFNDMKSYLIDGFKIDIEVPMTVKYGLQNALPNTDELLSQPSNSPPRPPSPSPSSGQAYATTALNSRLQHDVLGSVFNGRAGGGGGVSGGLGGGSSTRTRRRRNLSRRTQYTNKKNKRSSKSTKHNTIKHRKSYRKHNRTIKRRSYRK